MSPIFAHGNATRIACWLRRSMGYALFSALLSFLAVFWLPAETEFIRLWRGAVLGMAFFGFAAMSDLKSEELRRQRKTLRGTREIDPRIFLRIISADGLGVPCLLPTGSLAWGFRREARRAYLRVRREDETSHVLVCGDTRMGKSVLMHFWLCEIRQRGTEACLVYDPALEFWECHARPERGDLLLHPLFEDCPYWDIADEVRNPIDAKALAKSFLPDRREGRPDFWDLAPQKLLAFLLWRLREDNKGVADLLCWLSNPAQIDQMVAGTELAPLIEPHAAPQRAGVLASLNMIGEVLRLLPPDDGRPRFSFRRWAESGLGRPWVFIGSRPAEREALRPLVSAWLDTAFAKLLTRQDVATWVFVDELPTLQRLPKLKDALQEAGKYNVRFVLGFQGRAQLEQLYEREAETLMSAPGIRVFLRTKEFAAARWCAENIGVPEQERGTDSLTTSATDGGRDSLSTATERKTDYLVLPNEIQNLPRRTGYLRYDQYAVPISFDYLVFESKNAFREREILPAPRNGPAEAPRLRLLKAR